MDIQIEEINEDEPRECNDERIDERIKRNENNYNIEDIRKKKKILNIVFKLGVLTSFTSFIANLFLDYCK